MKVFHDLQEVNSARDVDIVVVERNAARFTNGFASSEMDHGRDFRVVFKDLGESWAVENVNLVEGDEGFDGEGSVLELGRGGCGSGDGVELVDAAEGLVG